MAKPAALPEIRPLPPETNWLDVAKACGAKTIGVDKQVNQDNYPSMTYHGPFLCLKCSYGESYNCKDLKLYESNKYSRLEIYDEYGAF